MSPASRRSRPDPFAGPVEQKTSQGGAEADQRAEVEECGHLRDARSEVLQGRDVRQALDRLGHVQAVQASCKEAEQGPSASEVGHSPPP